MTREEASTVIETFMENPLFSDVHKAAFNIAIHDIKQRHEWDINNLMLVPKSEWEQESILNKIRAEILEYIDDLDIANEICGIFDKYKAETETAE